MIFFRSFCIFQLNYLDCLIKKILYHFLLNHEKTIKKNSEIYRRLHE